MLSILNVLKNKVVLYMTTRYITYFIQFITSLILASKLGPYYLGVWGFYLVVLNYITFVNLGLPNSLSVNLVQNKNNENSFQSIINNTFALMLILICGIIIFSFIYFILEKYIDIDIKLNNTIFIICLCGIISHLNTLYSAAYRVKNKLFEVAINQSAVPILLFLVCFWGTGKDLLSILIWSYFIAEFLSLILYVLKSQISITWKYDWTGMKLIVKKGFYLFLYHTGYYFILLTIRSFISLNYTVEEFGYYTFSYTVANAILLLLQSFSVIIFPKLIDKYATNDRGQIHYVTNKLMNTSVTLSFLLILIALPCFPLLLKILPQYGNTNLAISLTALAVLLHSTAIYSSYLMAHNLDKKLSIVSLISLFVCVIISIILINIVRVSYEFSVISMIISYFVFSYLITHFARKHMNDNTDFFFVLFDFFPIRLLLPYILALVFCICGFDVYYMLIPPILFVILNLKQIKEILSTMLLILQKPQIININK